MSKPKPLAVGPVRVPRGSCVAAVRATEPGKARSGPERGGVVCGRRVENPKGKRFAEGTRVKYASDPPIYGTVLYQRGDCHYVDTEQYGRLRCATVDLREVSDAGD